MEAVQDQTAVVVLFVFVVAVLNLGLGFLAAVYTARDCQGGEAARPSDAPAAPKGLLQPATGEDVARAIATLIDGDEPGVAMDEGPPQRDEPPQAEQQPRALDAPPEEPSQPDEPESPGSSKVADAPGLDRLPQTAESASSEGLTQVDGPEAATPADASGQEGDEEVADDGKPPAGHDDLDLFLSLHQGQMVVANGVQAEEEPDEAALEQSADAASPSTDLSETDDSAEPGSIGDTALPNQASS
ncbi:MAG TPA: hypothetical protein EYP56_09345 [Planctomycetaceae bacterium]|nr:hypothetical protein [Planctomycetaceae bacterium]